MDVIALYKAKINNVVGTMGVSLSEHHIEMFKKSKNIKHVILGFDNDEAGKTATITAGSSSTCRSGRFRPQHKQCRVHRGYH